MRVFRRPEFPRPRQWARKPARRTVLVILVVIVGTVFTATGLAQLRVETGVSSFLPTSDPASKTYEQVSQSFGGDPIVVLLETEQAQRLQSGDQIPRELRLEGDLAKLPDVAAVYGPGTILNQIAGQAQNLLAELAGRRAGVRSKARANALQQGASDSAAESAADRASASFDRRYGSLLASGLPAGLPTLHNDSFVKTVIYGRGETPRLQWRFVVPNPHAIAILVRPREGLDQDAIERLVSRVRETVSHAKLDTSRVTVSGGPAVVAAIGNQVRREVPFVGAIACVMITLCFLLIPWTRKRRRLLPVIATLLATGLTLAAFGWIGHPISLGVVAFLPVLLGVGSYYPTYLARHAKQRLVLVVALATAGSFSTLTLSPMPFVRDLGVAFAFGILCAYAVGWLLVRAVGGQHDEQDGNGHGEQLDNSEAYKVKSVSVRGPAMLRRWLAAIVVAVTASAGWIALPHLSLESDFDTFSEGLPAFSNVQHVQQVLRSSGEVDVVLRGADVTTREAMTWMHQAHNKVITQHGDKLSPVISPRLLLSFLGPAPSQAQIQAGLRLLPSYLVHSVIRDDRKMAVLAFGARVDEAHRLLSLRNSLLATLPPPPTGYDVQLSGLPVLAARGFELVSADRYATNLAGACAAGLILALGLRRRADAVRAVLAAVIATGTGLFLLWITGIALNPVTVALGSLTAAVGCEFTVMLAEARRTRSRRLRNSVALAAATSTLGYAALAASGMHAISDFGLLLAGSVVLALLSAHFVVWLSHQPWSDGNARAELGEAASTSTETMGARA